MPKKDKPLSARGERHESYARQVGLLADEMGYDVEGQWTNPPGVADLVVTNPKNGRIALMEVEVTFQQQLGHVTKLANRWGEVLRSAAEGRDMVILIIGARRRDLIAVCQRAEIPDASSEYGRRIFSCVSYSDQNEIRAILLRCLGDD